MGFYRAVGHAEAGPDLQHVVATRWGQAMADTDPDRDRIIAAVQAGTLATITNGVGYNATSTSSPVTWCCGLVAGRRTACYE